MSPHSNTFWEALLPQEFESHIRFLSKHYRFVSLDELFLLPAWELRNACAVVFDDAFMDFFDYALPILERYRVPVSMFVPVDCVERNLIIWTSQVDNCFKFTTRSKLDLSIQGQRTTYSLSNETERIKAAGSVLEFLKGLPNKERITQLEWLRNELGYKDDVHVASMTWSHITATRNRISYQSHTMTHPLLSCVEDRAALHYELDNSKARLSTVVGTDVKYIAYPLGAWTSEVVDCAKSVYEAGFAVGNQLVELKRLHDPAYRYTIPRFNIHDSSPFELIFRINGFHALLTRSSHANS